MSENWTRGSTTSSIQKEIRVVVIDDHVLFRQGVVEILSTEVEIHVVGECSNDDATLIADQLKPDIALWGTDRSGIRAEKTLREVLIASPQTKIIIMAMHDDPKLVANMITAGAGAYVLKDSTREELVSVVRKVHRNSSQVVLSVSRETLQSLNRHSQQILSARECEVLALVAAGMRNSQIAGKLYISEGTVKRHLTNIYIKLSAVSRVDAIKKAISLKLLSINDILGSDGTPANGRP
ncbi:MAG: response regulator transcription factor [Actinomycetota bacterium]|nr:response regulator transcription factor [Actinomycetota bacterium]